MFYRHTPTGFIWEIPGKTVDEATEDLLGALAGVDFVKLNSVGASKHEMELLKRAEVVICELPVYAAEEHPGGDVVDIADHRPSPEYKMPKITVMSEEERAGFDRRGSLESEMLDAAKATVLNIELLEVVAKTARTALCKLDIEFNRRGNGEVDHLEGWCEANQLRYAIKDLDKFEARKTGDA